MESNPARYPSRVLVIVGVFVSILALTTTFSSLSLITLTSLSTGRNATFDLQYNPETKFEIVVSMYDEDPSSVRRMLERLLSTTPLLAISPKLTIYIKDQSASLSDLKSLLGAANAYRLSNTGREGGTYLHHIVTNWDYLAEQTLFIQAHAHNMHEVIPRMNNYLVPDTGMLSLGFAGVSCPCWNCGDRWGWEDRDDAIPNLYQRVYGKECQKEEKILLSYKGQFVASARRIRGIKRKVYQDLLNTLITTASDERLSGSNSDQSPPKEMEEKVVGGTVGNNTPDNPRFGFTMERIWGLLLQCGTDERVMALCPSLLSGMIRRPSRDQIAECQCLDSSVVEVI